MCHEFSFGVVSLEDCYGQPTRKPGDMCKRRGTPERLPVSVKDMLFLSDKGGG
jgi:hypothetical protein